MQIKGREFPPKISLFFCLSLSLCGLFKCIQLENRTWDTRISFFFLFFSAWHVRNSTPEMVWGSYRQALLSHSSLHLSYFKGGVLSYLSPRKGERERGLPGRACHYNYHYTLIMSKAAPNWQHSITFNAFKYGSIDRIIDLTFVRRAVVSCCGRYSCVCVCVCVGSGAKSINLTCGPIGLWTCMDRAIERGMWCHRLIRRDHIILTGLASEYSYNKRKWKLRFKQLKAAVGLLSLYLRDHKRHKQQILL